LGRNENKSFQAASKKVFLFLLSHHIRYFSPDTTVLEFGIRIQEGVEGFKGFFHPERVKCL
jgi:hypothetical protein